MLTSHPQCINSLQNPPLCPLDRASQKQPSKKLFFKKAVLRSGDFINKQTSVKTSSKSSCKINVYH